MQNETTKAVIQDVVDSSHKGVESLTRRSFIGISSLAIAGACLFRPARMWAAARHMKVDSKAFLTDFKPSVGFVEFRNSETIVGGYRVEWWEKNFGLPLTINYAPAIHNSIRSFKKVFEEHIRKGKFGMRLKRIHIRRYWRLPVPKELAQMWHLRMKCVVRWRQNFRRNILMSMETVKLQH